MSVFVIESSLKYHKEKTHMMGGRSWDDWIEEYAEGHRHPVNRLTHSIGIPMKKP